MYWECECGAKAFFGLPIYGKPIRHVCQKTIGLGKRSRPWTVVKEVPERDWQEIGRDKIFQCPCCNKIFKNEKGFSTHIIQMKKSDPLHKDFFEAELDLIDFDESDDQMDSFRISTKISENPGFGSVSLRKKKRNKTKD